MKPGEVEHEPVLVKEVLEYLAPRPGGVYLDCNLGDGGHSLEILTQLKGEGLVAALDVDPAQVKRASLRIEAAGFPPSLFRPIVGNHARLLPLLAEARIPAPDGVLFDLGPSTPQLLNPRLGLSWTSPESLDMRLDPASDSPSAADVVNGWSEEELTRLFRERGDEKWAARIARRIAEARREAPVRTGAELARIVEGAIPRAAWPPKIHPATRVFLALRIEVNGEMDALDAALPQALEALKPGGRLVVISFHGGEDARVKRFLQENAKPPAAAPWPLPQRGTEGKPRLKILTPRPIPPSEEEAARNPRSRSARLRAAVKLE